MRGRARGDRDRCVQERLSVWRRTAPARRALGAADGRQRAHSCRRRRAADDRQGDLMGSPEVQPASADQAAFLSELIDANLLLESGVPGLYGHSAVFEDVRWRLEQRLTREALAQGAEQLRFPPLLPRRQLEQSGYLASFPHLAGTVYAFDGDEAQAALQSDRASRHEDWTEFQAMTDLALMPAACYPVYPAIAARGRLSRGGVFVEAGGSWVFRHEPSRDPARRQIFHQHELVRIGEPETVLDWRHEWAERGLELLGCFGLDAQLD